MADALGEGCVTTSSDAGLGFSHTSGPRASRSHSKINFYAVGLNRLMYYEDARLSYTWD